MPRKMVAAEFMRENTMEMKLDKSRVNSKENDTYNQLKERIGKNIVVTLGNDLFYRELHENEIPELESNLLYRELSEALDESVMYQLKSDCMYRNLTAKDQLTLLWLVLKLRLYHDSEIRMLIGQYGLDVRLIDVVERNGQGMFRTMLLIPGMYIV